MTTYSSKNLNEYLDLTAGEKNISEQELRKNIYINDFAIVRNHSLFFGFFKAERDFREIAKKYDAVVNLKKSFNFGLEYKISATGVKFKEN